MHNNDYILSCDIGGSHITSAIVDKSNWTIVDNTITRSQVNSLENAKSIFLDWTSNMKDCMAKIGIIISHIGIAAPGPFDYDRGIALMKGQSKYDSIYNIQVSDPIKEGLGDLNINIKYINDAAAFLQGEVFGAGLDNESRILGITLGTGLGSAVWNTGDKAFDANLWDTPYKESIFEEYLVTRWFVSRFEELTKIKENGLKEILENHANDPAINLMMNEYQENFINFLTFFSEKFDCNTFIIGGNIVKAWNTIFPDLSILKPFNIQIGKFQEHAAIIGAASLFSNS